MNLWLAACFTIIIIAIIFILVIFLPKPKWITELKNMNIPIPDKAIYKNIIENTDEFKSEIKDTILEKNEIKGYNIVQENLIKINNEQLSEQIKFDFGEYKNAYLLRLNNNLKTKVIHESIKDKSYAIMIPINLPDTNNLLWIDGDQRFINESLFINFGRPRYILNNDYEKTLDLLFIEI